MSEDEVRPAISDVKSETKDSLRDRVIRGAWTIFSGVLIWVVGTAISNQLSPGVGKEGDFQSVGSSSSLNPLPTESTAQTPTKSTTSTVRPSDATFPATTKPTPIAPAEPKKISWKVFPGIVYVNDQWTKEDVVQGKVDTSFAVADSAREVCASTSGGKIKFLKIGPCIFKVTASGNGFKTSSKSRVTRNVTMQQSIASEFLGYLAPYPATSSTCRSCSLDMGLNSQNLNLRALINQEELSYVQDSELYVSFSTTRADCSRVYVNYTNFANNFKNVSEACGSGKTTFCLRIPVRDLAIRPVDMNKFYWSILREGSEEIRVKTVAIGVTSDNSCPASK